MHKSCSFPDAKTIGHLPLRRALNSPVRLETRGSADVATPLLRSVDYRLRLRRDSE